MPLARARCPDDEAHKLLPRSRIPRRPPEKLLHSLAFRRLQNSTLNSVFVVFHSRFSIPKKLPEKTGEIQRTSGGVVAIHHPATNLTGLLTLPRLNVAAAAHLIVAIFREST